MNVIVNIRGFVEWQFDLLLCAVVFPFQDSEISSDRHALIVPPFMGHGNRVHPMPYPDSSTPRKSFFFGCTFSYFKIQMKF